MGRTGVVARALLGVWVLALSSCEKAQDIQFDYSPTLDAICSALFAPSIEERWKSELRIVLPQLEKEWEDLGVALVHASEEVIGERIDQNATVHVTLCNTPSRARPLILNMRYALGSFTAMPVPLSAKVGTLHHELLHRAIDELVQNSSALLTAHADERERVKGHIHLLAVQKATYLQLGLVDELAELVDVDSQLPNGHYKRAWEIVNAEPTRYEELVRELLEAASG